MSLFRKPKKPIQRRVFSSYDEEENHENNDISTHDDNNKMVLDVDDVVVENKLTSTKEKKKDKKIKENTSNNKFNNKMSLLSFDDEEEDEGEIFQVKKSSHSKKVMKMLDKERRKKKHHQNSSSSLSSSSSTTITSSSTKDDIKTNKIINSNEFDSNNYIIKKEKTDNSNNIQTEIRTDDFVLVVKNSDPENLILNGRAAVCAGRDDMSSEEEEHENDDALHKFAKPDDFKICLENGEIPDAAMIHAARKRRQKAREQSDFISIEDREEELKKGKRTVREDGAGDGSDEDEERIDMSAITGAKEREERREQFFAAQDSEDDSDQETNDWENQQIRKGVTGAQLVSAQQESIYSQYMIQPFSNSFINSANNNSNTEQLSTAALLEQAYANAKSLLEKPKPSLQKTQLQNNKANGPQAPQDIAKKLKEKLVTTSDLNIKHYSDIDRISTDIKLLKMDSINYEYQAPVAAAKYRFYQEIRCYLTDLIECLDEKFPQITQLEQKANAIYSKYSSNLVERRRQDVQDQTKEISELTRGIKKGPEDLERIRRAAEREGRRTRRRRDREKNNCNESHLDGMSSDDEIPDHDLSQYKQQLDTVQGETQTVFDDVSDEFYRLDEILERFGNWKTKDLDSYKEAFVSLCLPKVIGLIIRLRLATWNPFQENYQEIEKMDWFNSCLRFNLQTNETEDMLAKDPDIRLIPAIVEKIIIPKLTEIVETCWDPLSTTQTLKLVGVLNRISREYPSLHASTKTLRDLFQAILDKMKVSLNNDVYIPIFPKQSQDAKSSFFQRQFCSGLKLFRNILSLQGLLANNVLKDLAITSLLNRYLLSAMRVCTVIDAAQKAYILMNTLPRIWLNSEKVSHLQSLSMFITFLKNIESQLDKTNPLHLESIDKVNKILQTLLVKT